MEYIVDKEQYLKVVAVWKQTADHPAADHVVYNLIRGFDPKRGFSVITNPNKLSNGTNAWLGFNQAMQHARWMVVKGRDQTPFIKAIGGDVVKLLAEKL